MNGIAATLSDISQTLKEIPIHFALLGGLAVSVRTEPRFTRDIDLAVAVGDDAQAESLIHRLQSRGYLIATIVEQEQVHRLATVRLQPPGQPPEGLLVDLLFASSGIEPEIVHEATHLEVFQGLHLPVCRVGHLLALKILARDDMRRPQDIIDIHALLKNIDQNELHLARSSLNLITLRGFHRSRDLIAAIDKLLSRKADGRI